MIDKVISDFKDTQENIEENFTDWSKFTVQMSNSVSVEQKMVRVAHCWSRFCSNVESENAEGYYKRSISIPFMDEVVNDLESRLEDRNHVDIFGILPSVMFKKSFNFNDTIDKLTSTSGIFFL